MCEVEDGTRTLIEEVPIEVATAEQRDPVGDLALDLPARVDCRICLRDALAEMQPRDDSPIALNGVIAEICGETGADKRREDLARPQANLTE